MIGERSRPIPPIPTGGMSRRIGPSTGSVRPNRKSLIVPRMVPREVGNHERMIRPKMIAM